MKFEIIAGGKALNDGLITGPYSVICVRINDEGNRSISSSRTGIQSLKAAINAESDMLSAYHGATFPHGRLAEQKTLQVA